MTKRHADARLDQRWARFHSVVNMTSEQLRSHLMTQAAGESGFTAGPDLGVPDEGRHILAVLAKRKMDLTEADLELMDDVVTQVTDLLAARPPAGAADDRWRRDLMSLGHDPLGE